MNLSADEVKKIAYLARLGINDNDIDAYASELSNMLDLMTQMSDTNTDAIQPMAHPMDQTQRFRADIASEKNQRQNFQSIAPQIENGLYLVPKVLD
ncbi:MAG: Asp-tRNA(Asn)/Glu-tRNA(Gln) amidotransferase subunit GatC [Methylococcaceae bacterium]|nr:Asp-tRNA(Asn)/Glu-tRNA(Gln) amidotransferase subunit GatC [Methylococcaceae bacterium]